MHLCCESTRFEHNVIVGRGANETCPRSAGANEMCPRSAGANESCSRKAGVRSARGSEEPEQHDARHLVEMSAGCASATLRARVGQFPIKDRHFPIRTEFAFCVFCP